MTTGLTPSEKFFYAQCKETFLSLWSFVNPIGKEAKELCDILVVCDPHVIVISVKDIKFEATEDDYDVKSERWLKRAVEKSTRQIDGAIHHLQLVECVLDNQRKEIKLPPQKQRVYHRIAIAVGGKRCVSIPFLKSDDGHVTHVFDEHTAAILLQHLNTISDFIEYLSWKEWVQLNKSGVLLGGEENLLALYFTKAFEETEYDFVMVEDDIWEEFLRSPLYQAKLEADQVSYIWDDLIELVAANSDPNFKFLPSATNNHEEVLRMMARENRHFRRNLSECFHNFLESAKQGKMRSRLCYSPQSTTCYVWLCGTREDTRSVRQGELYLRCIAAIANIPPETKHIVGIASNAPEQIPDEGSAIDMLCLKKEGSGWLSEWVQQSHQIKKEFGYFNNNPTWGKFDYEFPPSRE